MARHETFAFVSIDELENKAGRLGFSLPVHPSVSPLLEPILIGGRKIPNRFAVQPMEGADALESGAPGEWTFRRYRRYAEGGSGLLWFEAASVSPEGRSNPRQLLLNNETVDAFKRLVEDTRSQAMRHFGNGHVPVLILQLTHSGRYSKPGESPAPLAAWHNPRLEKGDMPLRILSDQELDALMACFLDAARLARDAGFDGIDIKACHGYLVHELLGAFGREQSEYGGPFENRTRFLISFIREMHRTFPDLIPCVRLGVYDGISYPYGFGMKTDGSTEPDLTEPLELAALLVESGCRLLNITAGNPYYAPHITRPFDKPAFGTAIPDEHPLESVHRLLDFTAQFQRTFPNTPIVGSGYSWLRHFMPWIASAAVQRKEAGFFGMGRSALAYPDLPRDLMDHGRPDPSRCCITCSKCTELLRKGFSAGCVISDPVYAKHYKMSFAS